MPKALEVSTSTRTPRRSSRLNKNHTSPQPIHTAPVVNIRKRKSIVKGNLPLCTKDEPSSVAVRPLSPLEPRRSHPITSDLLKREKALATEELEYKRRASELDERALILMKREAEASRLLSQVAEREAAASLSQLEEHFTCALTVAAVCESLIEKLRRTPSSALVVKREDSEGAWEAGWANCTRKKEASKEVDELGENADLAAWREDGFTRTEWLKKDRQVNPLFPLDCQPFTPVPIQQRRQTRNEPHTERLGNFDLSRLP
ncbi:hypothetical protein H0H92_009919 [Tricholoma furcatifolium]|nr:hypothetical protein H0H92_009919 [Tricholoma furcatifolium]